MRSVNTSKSKGMTIGKLRVVGRNFKGVFLHMTACAGHQRIGMIATAQMPVVKEVASQCDPFHSHGIIFGNVEIGWKTLRYVKGIRGGLKGGFHHGIFFASCKSQK